MTEDEYVAVGAEALMRLVGENPETIHPEAALYYVERARTVIDAVGAWMTREALRTLMQDERFDLMVGGNPNSVAAMLAECDAALRKTGA